MNTLFDTSSEEDEPVNNKEIPTIEPIPTQTEQKPTIQLQLTAPKNKMLHMSPSTCSNCGKTGHIFYQCKLPFTSYGIILFRINTNKEPAPIPGIVNGK